MPTQRPVRHVQGRSLAAVGRAWARRSAPGRDASELPVCVVNTGGAGGLLVADREPAGVRVSSFWSDLRDLGDLAGNAARVVAAADDLFGRRGDVPVRVGLPDAPGWARAVEEIEAAGLEAGVRVPREVSGAALAARLSVLVEADCGFVLLDENPPTPARLAGLLALVRALVDGAGADGAGAALDTVQAETTETGVAEVFSTLAADATRIRRRLRAVAVSGAAGLAASLSV